ncbi:hypothetical protein V8C86DRAFT_2820218 [Haematococcus lacustris]
MLAAMLPVALHRRPLPLPLLLLPLVLPSPLTASHSSRPGARCHWAGARAAGPPLLLPLQPCPAPQLLHGGGNQAGSVHQPAANSVLQQPLSHVQSAGHQLRVRAGSTGHAGHHTTPVQAQGVSSSSRGWHWSRSRDQGRGRREGSGEGGYMVGGCRRQGGSLGPRSMVGGVPRQVQQLAQVSQPGSTALPHPPCPWLQSSRGIWRPLLSARRFSHSHHSGPSPSPYHRL